MNKVFSSNFFVAPTSFHSYYNNPISILELIFYFISFFGDSMYGDVNVLNTYKV